MGKRVSALLSASLAGVLLCFSFATATKAELSIDEMKKLLQESLTITEIDREVARLSEEELQIGARIEETKQAIIQQNERLEQTKVHAGKVLRSYYMGDRDALWLLLLHADNFSDALSIFQYLKYIAESDTRSMNRFLGAFHELKALQQQLSDRQTELRKSKEDYLEQRDRLVKLQQELDRKLAEVENKDQLLAQMAELNNAWRKDGLPLFRTFLEAMSAAMLHLDAYLDENGNEDALEQNLRTFLFHIKDDPLNRFLRKQDPLFENFIYTITEENIIINGKQGPIHITVKGHYTIEKEPEDALRFILDEMTYNSFVLPDTTRADMQKQFSMTFYPKRNPMTQALEINSVSLKQGEMIVELTYSP